MKKTKLFSGKFIKKYLFILFLTVLIYGCTNSAIFFKTTVQGTLKNSDTDNGINGATVEIYDNAQ